MTGRVLRSWRILALALVAGLAFGCGLGLKAKRTTTVDVTDFRDAVPGSDALTLSLPSSAAQTMAVGDLAVFYEATVDFTRKVNGHVLSFLVWIDEISRLAPTQHVGDTYVWGPWIQDGLSPVAGRFTMTRTGPENFEYTLDWRPRAGGDWTHIVTGYITAFDKETRRSIGGFTMDYDAAAALDPTLQGTGSIEVIYDLLTDGRDIEVKYTNFQDIPGDMRLPLNGDYHYRNLPDDSGKFLFDYLYDLEWNGHPDGKIEHGWFDTRWQPTGAGRTDEVVDGGGIPDIEIGGKAVQSLVLSECWGTDFKEAWFNETARFADDASTVVYEVGDEASCVFDQELPTPAE